MRQGAEPRGAHPPSSPRGAAARDGAHVLGGQWHDAALVVREDLRPGDVVPGPAIIAEKNATTVVEPGWEAELTGAGPSGAGPRRSAWPRSSPVGTTVDPVLLEVFNNLFMNIAEQMGLQAAEHRVLGQHHERLDFSCALFDAEGNLIANAPHMPVHLGSMGEHQDRDPRETRASMQPATCAC